MTFEELPSITASHLAKSIDLNHHGTLFAGRMAEWVVEAGFMTARAVLGCSPDELVCARLDRLDFSRSVPKGNTVVISGEAAHVGRSSVTIHLLSSLLGANNVRETVTEAYATFVHVEGQRATPHGLVVSPPTDPDRLTRWKHIVAQRSAAQA